MATMGLEEKLAVLAEHSLLKHVDPGELSQLAAYATVAQHRPRAIIFRQGDPGSSMMAVLSGRVRICSYSAEGKEVTLNIVRKGEYFGEIALLDGKHRTAEAVAIEDTSLLVLERRHFLPWLESHPTVCLRMFNVLCDRLRRTSTQLEDTLFLEVPIRLARCLVRLATAFGVEERGGGTRIDVKLSQQQLGTLVGITRESTNKHLNEWQRDGLITVSAGSITIRDLDGLRELADFYDEDEAEA
ncbi:Crp/Fnr family transcriptional regulator [Skermanella mucosa]|uniref:Crp/Fnr family transcriptional regulator n=1 Tax=Skermanella mucosa TaxID=1789672 RepID=UPI00192B8BAB|nr:Crp/Fnr family transcriptional regulator [Skermanella mucosa]UEM18861.1 Crp/Fnr family transcriptional regulator [Skermanella mucosa]